MQVPLERSGEYRGPTWGGREGDGGDAGGSAGNPQSGVFLRQLLIAGGDKLCHESPQVLTKRESG